MPTRLRLAVVWLLLPAGASYALAQGNGTDRDGEEALVRESDHDDDPLSIERTDGLDRVPVEPDRRRAEDSDPERSAPPRTAEVPVREGEVLTAPAGVRETDHRVDVQLIEGLAHVRLSMRFVNFGRHPAELRYRLATPERPTLTDLQVCAESGCRKGQPTRAAEARTRYDFAVRTAGGEDARPVAYAAPVPKEQGPALALRLAPVAPEGEVTLELGYLVSAPQHGGVVRLTLPARGTDPRVAPATVKAEAHDLLAPSIAGASAHRRAEVAPWHAAEIVAKAPTASAVQPSAWRFACGERTCARLRVAAGARRGPAVDLILAIDASPSTVGAARNRMKDALASLVAAAPEGSRVRAVAFGSRAEAVLDEPVRPTKVPVSALARASTRALGSATRFEAAWDRIAPWLDRKDEPERDRRPLVVIVGDGGLTRGAHEGAWRRAAELGTPIDVVNIADRPTWKVLRRAARRTGGIVVEAGAEAQRATDGQTSAALEERVASLFAPPAIARLSASVGRGRVRLGPLRAGEERVWEGAISRRGGALHAPGLREPLKPAPEALRAALGVRVARAMGHAETPVAFAALDPDGLGPEPSRNACSAPPADRAPGGVGGVPAPVAVAGPAACEGAQAAASDEADERTGRGIPKQTVRTMVRQRVIPAARRCLRRDRAGRPDYSVRAELHFRLADREIVSARVAGDIDATLRECLLGALDTLDVPRFRGAVQVRYPIYTKRATKKEPIELRRDVASDVDEVIEDEALEEDPPTVSPAAR